MSRWRVVLEARDALLHAIAPALTVGRFIQRGHAIARSLRTIRRNRPMQLSLIRPILCRPSLG
jgi:hypothetical protein